MVLDLSCRKVVKTLLDLGAADVNLRGSDGLVPLHLASRLGDPEKIAMLLDNRADPHIHTPTGATAMDIVQSLTTKILTSGGYNTKGDHNRLRLCLELLERALATTLPRHATSESGSPPSILTGHGSSILMPEESDNFQASMSRSVIGGSSAGLLGNIDFYPNLSQGFLHGKGNALSLTFSSNLITCHECQEIIVVEWVRFDMAHLTYALRIHKEIACFVSNDFDTKCNAF